MLEHGGRLGEAVRRWGGAREDWLDLSTGIAPWSYPLPAPPADVWQRLPEDGDGLEAVACAYYGAVSVLMVPGSQAAIQALPGLVPAGRVAMPAPIYAEHPAAWQRAGHAVVDWDEPADYAVLCNPNNPTGERFSRAALLERVRTLRLLVVDEAFIDANPAQSLAGDAADNVVVLRSLGKFFGLAGARVGCVIAPSRLLDRLREIIGPWAVSHPARWAACRALADHDWQAAQNARLDAASARLAELLRACGLGEVTGCALFRYVSTPDAGRIHEQLAMRGILVRRFDVPSALRFGLPRDEDQWRKLTTCLQEIA